MKITSSIFLSISLLCASYNAHAYSVNEFKGDCKIAVKNSGTLVLAAGKTVVGLAALYLAVAVPVASIHQLRDTSALTGTIHGEFKKYRVNNTVESYPTGFEFKDINLLPVATIGIGIASMASAVLGYVSIKSAWNDVQEILK